MTKSKVIRIYNEHLEYLKTFNDNPNDAIKIIKNENEEKVKMARFEGKIITLERLEDLILSLADYLKLIKESQARIEAKLITVPAKNEIFK